MSGNGTGGAEPLTRRSVLIAAGRLGAAAAFAPLTGWLAACAPNAAPRGASHPATQSPAASAASSPTATPDTRPVTVAIAGDVMLGRSINTQILSSRTRYPFEATADFLRAADLTVGNLECVVSRLGAAVPGKQYHFRADPAAFGRLQAAGFDVLSVANNHSGDFGKAAYADMLAQLDAQGLAPLGGGLRLATAHAPVIRRVRATTIGFLAYCEIAPMSFAATATSPGHAWLDPVLMRADITAVRHHVDYLVVFMHWGIEYQTQQTAHQRGIARQAIEAGADLIVGSHPHVIQPSETYAGKPIVYSLGNFVFDQMDSDDVRRGEVLLLHIDGARLVGMQVVQSYISGSHGAPVWVQAPPAL